jgi:hypothetical protein
MRDDVERLAHILGQPVPARAPVPWERSIPEIGFQFPSDYREFIDMYGSISIRDELHIWTPSLLPGVPGAGPGFPGFVQQTTEGVGQHLALAYEQGDLRECPFPIFPSPGGLLGWAHNSNVDHCFWLTVGDDPDGWPIAIWYRQLAKWDRFDGGMVEFLFAVLSGDYPMAGEIAPGDPNVPLWVAGGDWTSWRPR